ncbi:MAG: hypothetical protein QXM16_06685 [Nitrososphaerota archaeon]
MGRASLALLGVLLLLSLAPGLVFASSVGEGAYIAYSYSVDYGDRSVRGVIREEVVRDYGNGTIRLRLEATFNDGVATLEKNVPERFFIIPRLTHLFEGQFTYSNSNYSIAVSSTRIGSAQVSVGGRTYLANIYSITGAATISHRDRTTGEVQSTRMEFSGVITLINGSNILYSAEGEATGSSGRSVRLVTSLLDTNLDLLADPTGYSSTSIAGLAPVMLSLPSDGLGLQAPLYGTGREAKAAQAADDYWGRALVVVVAGLVALAVVSAFSLRHQRRAEQVEGLERKPHYV